MNNCQKAGDGPTTHETVMTALADLTLRVQSNMENCWDNTEDKSEFFRDPAEFVVEMYNDTDLLDREVKDLLVPLVQVWLDRQKGLIRRNSGFNLNWHTEFDDFDNVIYVADSPYHDGDGNHFKFRLEPALRNNEMCYINASDHELTGDDGRGEELGTLEEAFYFINQCVDNILASAEEEGVLETGPVD